MKGKRIKEGKERFQGKEQGKGKRGRSEYAVKIRGDAIFLPTR